MAFNIDPSAPPLVQTSAQPYGAPPDAQPGIPVTAGRGGSLRLPGGGSPFTRPVARGGAGNKGYGYGPNEMPPLDDYFKSHATLNQKDIPSLSSADDSTLAGIANDYATKFIPGALEGAYQRKADKSEVDSHVARFNMQFANNLPKFREHLAKMEAAGGAPVAPAAGAPGLTSALGTHALGAAEQGGSEIASGLPGAIASAPGMEPAMNVLRMIPGGADFVKRGQEGIRQTLNPLMAPAAASLKKSGEEDLAANPDVLKNHPYLKTGAEIVGGVAPYAASALAGPAGPVSVGMAQMGGEKLVAEQQRINALKPEELNALPEYQKILQASGGDHDKAKALLAKASSEAAEQVGEIGGALMGSIGGGGLTKTAQQAIANVVGKSVLKRVLATAGAEGAGFETQAIAGNAATTAATNKATGGKEKADLLAGADQQGLMGVGMGALGALLHTKVNPLTAGKPGAKPKAGEPTPTATPEAKPGEPPPPAAPGAAPGAAPAGLKPEQSTAYQEASAATLANPEYHVKPGTPEETAQASLIPALEDFEGKLNASDAAFTPEQKTAALAQFENDWRKQFGVEAAPEAPTGVKETTAPTPAEAASVVGGEPTPETTPTAEPIAPAAPEAPAAPPGEVRQAVEPTAPGEVRAVAPGPEPLSVRDLVTQKGVDTGLPFGLTEQVVQEYRSTHDGKDPSAQEINDLAKMHLDAVGVKYNDIYKREALGKLLEQNPKEHPTREAINAKAAELENNLKKGGAKDAIQERLKAFEKSEPVATTAKESPLAAKSKPRVKVPIEDVLAKKAEAGAKEKAPAYLRKAGEKDEFGYAVTGRAAHEVRAEIIKGEAGKIKGVGKEVFKALTKLDKLEVVQSMDRLPQEAIDAYNEHPEAGPIKGYYDPVTEKSWLVADHLQPGEAVPTILHEVGAHYGLKRMLVPSMYNALERYVEATRHLDTPDGRELAKAYADAQAAQTDPGNQLNETMATMITNRGGEKGTIWARAMANLRAFLYNRLGKYLPDSLSSKLINNDTIIELARGAIGKTYSLEKNLRHTDEPWIDHPGQFSRTPLKDTSKAEGDLGKVKPATIDDLERAWKVRPVQKETVPEKKAFEQTAFQKVTTKIANVLKPLMHYKEAMVKAGSEAAAKTGDELYSAFVRVGGMRKHIVDSDYHSVIEPVENKAAELMAEHGVEPEKFWDAVIRYIGAKHALEDNRRGELENVRLTDEGEAARAPLKLKLHEGLLDPKEYLARLKEIVNTPGARIEKNVPPLSGVSNVLAHEAVARAGKDVPVEALEAMNTALNPAREKHIQNGLASKTYTPNDINLLRAYDSKYYLPNTGFADENILPSGSSRPLGAFTKEAGYQAGRTTLGANPLDNFIRALRRSGEDIANNQATKAAYSAAIAKGNTLGARVKTYNVESLVRDALAGGGKLSDVQKVFKDSNSVVHNDGKFRHVITYPENSPVLEAMKKSQEVPDVGGITKNVGKATSLLARLYAGLNPSFAVVTSLARDSTAYPTMLLADGKFAAAASYVKNYTGFGGPFGAWKTFLGGKSIFNKSLGEIIDYAKANPDSFAGWYTRLSEKGGAFNFKDELQEVRKSQDLLDKLKHESRNILDPREYWTHFKQFQDSIATGSLMIGRTSVFKSLVEGGMDEGKAAQYVKELTNFQQRSGTTDVLNHWFAFSRVGMASADRIAQFLKNEDGSFNYKKAAGLVALGTAYGALSYQLLINQMGEDKAKLLTNDSLSRNFIIPNGTDRPYQIPMGLGLPRLMFGLGMMATRWAHGHTTTKEAAESYKNTVMENLSPLHPIQPEAGASASVQAGDLLTAMIPTVARPAAEVALNQSSFGTPITREQTNGRFKSDSGKQTTPEFWVNMAKGIKDMGGPDMFPESLQYMTNAYGGGALGMFLRSMKADRLEEIGQTPSAFQRYLPQLENRDIDFAGSKSFYQQKDRLQEAVKEASALKAEGKPIPPKLQASLDEEKKLNAASRDHSKQLKAVNDNRLLSKQAKASQLAAINERFKHVQEQLSREASRVVQ